MAGSSTPRIGLVGCGHRGVAGFLMAAKDLCRADRVVALCDSNPARLNFAWEVLGNPACRRCTDYREFLACPGLDTVIVATPDHSHREVVVTALQAGKDVVCEKPMATTLDDCRAMLAARGGRSLRLAFNFRYNTLAIRVKQLLREGAIGRVLHVEARDVVAWDHGSDYFRRWHRFLDRSGGLLVHKSCHAFDVINWWLDDVPARVFARASRSFYLPARQRGERCSSCTATQGCPFFVDLCADVPGQHCGIADFYRHMYVEAEKHDGYVRDVCVFHAASTTPDTYSVNALYRKGMQLAYSALFFAPYEDRIFGFQGDDGRLEVSRFTREIRLWRGLQAKQPECIQVPIEPGTHEGADVRLLRAVFGEEDSELQRATAEDGYWSVAVAACANDSIRTGADVPVPPL